MCEQPNEIKAPRMNMIHLFNKTEENYSRHPNSGLVSIMFSERGSVGSVSAMVGGVKLSEL